MKKCSRCKIPQSPDNFSPAKAYKDGKASRCKTCQREVVKQARLANPDKEKQQRAKDNKKWRHSPKGIAYMAEHTEERRAYSIAYNEKNAEYIAQRAAAYYQRTKTERDAYTTAWRKANPSKWSAIHKRWVANKKGASINDFSSDQWLEVLLAFHFRCAYCPSTCIECRNKTHELTEDHITALSKSGPNTLHNVVPACRSCNAKKHTNGVPVPVQPMLLTMAPAKKK